MSCGLRQESDFARYRRETVANADRYHTEVEHWIIEGLIEMYVAGWSTARHCAAEFRCGGCCSVRP